MSKSLRALGLAVSALALTLTPANAQTKVTNEGISASEIVIGTHQDLSGPIKGWGVPVSNGMKMAVEEINAAGGIQGRKIKLIVEDTGYDPKKAVLASQKLIERDKIFAMVGPMGSPTVLAAQDVLFDAGVLQLFPLTAAEFTFKFDPAKPQERLKFNNLLPYVESTRAAIKYMVDWKHFQKPCIMHQDDEYGKNVLDGFNQQLEAMKLQGGLGDELQARRFRLLRAGRQDEVRRLRHGRARHHPPRNHRRDERGQEARLGRDLPRRHADQRARSAAARQGGGRRALCGLRLRNPLRGHGQGQGQGLAGQLQEDVRHRRQHPGDHRLQRGRDLCLLCQQGGQGPDRPEDARRAGVRRQVPRHLLRRRRPSSPRPTTSPTPSPRSSRSRTAAGCW